MRKSYTETHNIKTGISKKGFRQIYKKVDWFDPELIVFKTYVL